MKIDNQYYKKPGPERSVKFCFLISTWKNLSKCFSCSTCLLFFVLPYPTPSAP